MKYLRTITAVAALPAVAVCVYELIKLFLIFAGKTDMQFAPFWLGIISYFLFQIIFFKPMQTYVFGHELTHAIAGMLSGAEIKKFKVSKDKGSVTLTKNNIFITLSPYFIPLYSLIIIIIYTILAWFTDVKPFYSYYLFLSGLALSFHFALTFYAIKIGQEDMRLYGTFFSFVLVCFINVIMVAFILVLIFPHNINFKDFILNSCYNTVDLYKYIFNGVYQWFLSLKMK